MSKMIKVTCPECNQIRQMRLSNYKRGGQTGLCLPCFNKREHNRPGRPAGQTGKAYSTGVLIHDGYVLVRCPEHPHSHNGFVKRAILVLENKLGRRLLSTEHTHHINGKRDDDCPDNLMAVTNSEHARLHMKAKRNIRNKYETALIPEMGLRKS